MIRSFTVFSKRDPFEVLSDRRHRGHRERQDLSLSRDRHADRKRLAARVLESDQLIDIDLGIDLGDCLSSRLLGVLRRRRLSLKKSRLCRKIGNSPRDGLAVDSQEFGASSHRDAGYESRTQRLVDGPQALALLEIVGFVGPGALALKAAILRDFGLIRLPKIGGISASGPSTTRTFQIHPLGKSKSRTETSA